MEGFKKQLAGHTVIGVDTSVFIYHVKAHPRYLPLTQELLTGVQAGQWAAITPTVTVMELTVQPWQMGRSAVARRAAQLRAECNVRPADALQVATALLGGATAFVTNDRKLARLSREIAVIVLDDFASAQAK